MDLHVRSDIGVSEPIRRKGKGLETLLKVPSSFWLVFFGFHKINHFKSYWWVCRKCSCFLQFLWLYNICKHQCLPCYIFPVWSLYTLYLFSYANTCSYIFLQKISETPSHPWKRTLFSCPTYIISHHLPQIWDQDNVSLFLNILLT